jgi:hypothetical protein
MKRVALGDARGVGTIEGALEKRGALRPDGAGSLRAAARVRRAGRAVDGRRRRVLTTVDRRGGVVTRIHRRRIGLIARARRRGLGVPVRTARRAVARAVRAGAGVVARREGAEELSSTQPTVRRCTRTRGPARAVATRGGRALANGEAALVRQAKRPRGGAFARDTRRARRRRRVPTLEDPRVVRRCVIREDRASRGAARQDHRTEGRGAHQRKEASTVGNGEVHLEGRREATGVGRGDATSLQRTGKGTTCRKGGTSYLGKSRAGWAAACGPALSPKTRGKVGCAWASVSSDSDLGVVRASGSQSPTNRKMRREAGGAPCGLVSHVGAGAAAFPRPFRPRAERIGYARRAAWRASWVSPS